MPSLNRIFSTLPDVRSVPGANLSGSMRVNIPIVGRIFSIKAQVTKGGALASLEDMKKAIGEVRLILNSEVVRRCKLAEYFAAIEVNGFQNEDGLISYHLSEPWRAIVADDELLALDVRRYASVALEMDVTNDATPLEFTFDFEYDELAKVNAAGQQIVGMVSHTNQTENLGGGEPIMILNPLNGALMRMHFVVPAHVDVTRVRVLQGDTAIYDRWNTPTRPGIAQQLKDMGMRIAEQFTTANGSFKSIPIVFDSNQLVRTALTDTTGLKLQVSLSTGCAVNLLRETFLPR